MCIVNKLLIPVLTHCQLNKLPAAMAVLYADSTVSTNESMGALQTVLKHPLLSENLSLAVSDLVLVKSAVMIMYSLSLSLSLSTLLAYRQSSPES